MYIQTLSQDFWLSLMQCSLYLASDHMCHGLQSSLAVTIFQIAYSWTNRLLSHRLFLRKHSARLQLNKTNMKTGYDYNDNIIAVKLCPS